MRAPSVGYFEHNVLARRSEFDEVESVVEFVTAFVERAILFGDEHLYNDPYVVVQLASGAQGACFLHPEDLNTQDLDALPGKSAFYQLHSAAPYLRVALLDALYHHINWRDGIRPTVEYEFRGTGSQKSSARAQRLVNLAGVEKGGRVALIGLIVDIARHVLGLGAELQVADLAKAGMEVLGLRVHRDATPLVQWADTVIMTGNTLKTDTLASLLDAAVGSAKRILVYAMTGHHIAPRYLDFGVDVVTAEEFPYYWYATSPSRMRVYARGPL
jgi:hypothetical protein